MTHHGIDRWDGSKAEERGHEPLNRGRHTLAVVQNVKTPERV